MIKNMELSERYEWFVKEVRVEELLGNNRLENNTVIIIGVEDKKTGLKIPHPISHFIRQKYHYQGKSLSSQKNPARAVTMFLNFINQQISIGKSEFNLLKEKGITGLKLIHGARFITHLTDLRNKNGRRKYDYVKTIERYLIHFYYYLNDMNILDEHIEFDTYVDRREKFIIINPFDHPSFDIKYPPTNLPRRDKLKDFGGGQIMNESNQKEIDRRDLLVYLFIEEAKNVAPDIAFGIALQIFGGLRRGEVVNITPASIPTDFLRGSNYLAVLDNQERLFKHLTNTSKEQVKNPRIQPILPSNYIRDLFDDHMVMLDRIKKVNPYAFFVSKKGNTITGGSYEKKFAKVKYSFIDKLTHSPGWYSEFNMLEGTVWGSHIGRGIFTNYLLEMSLTDKQIALLRGDRSTESAKAYLDRRTAISGFNEAMEIFSRVDSFDDLLKYHNTILPSWSDNKTFRK